MVGFRSVKSPSLGDLCAGQPYSLYREGGFSKVTQKCENMSIVLLYNEFPIKVQLFSITTNYLICIQLGVIDCNLLISLAI